jgi:hypothetical protein
LRRNQRLPPTEKPVSNRVPGELIQVEYTAPDARSIAAMGLAYSKGAIDYLGPQSCSVLVTRIRPR